MSIDRSLAAITADNDQDRCLLRDWIRQSTNSDILAIWSCIQRKYKDPKMEIMSRFAQLALAEMIVEVSSNNGA